MRERWGTFSVRDHLTSAPFVSDVLMYDRLVIPVPPADHSQDEFWRQHQPDRLQQALDVLKIKTDKTDGFALIVPWDASKRDRFKNRMSVAAALATQHRSPEQQYYVDPFEMTRQLLKYEFQPALPLGVSKAWTVAAYTSADDYQRDVPLERRRQLAARIRHRFMTPSGSDPKHELLKRAVDLAARDDFRKKRARFYEWQEQIITSEISDEKAIEELEKQLRDYNDAILNAFNDAIYRYAFTAIPIGLSLAGAAIDGGLISLPIAGAIGLIEIARFWKFDRQPVIENGDFDAAAMIHDARAALPID